LAAPSKCRPVRPPAPPSLRHCSERRRLAYLGESAAVRSQIQQLGELDVSTELTQTDADLLEALEMKCQRSRRRIDQHLLRSTSPYASCTHEHRLYTGFPLFYRQKKSRTFQDPLKNFQDLFGARECLNTKTKRHLQYSKVAKSINIPRCIKVSNSQHKLAAILSLLVFHLSH